MPRAQRLALLLFGLLALAATVLSVRVTRRAEQGGAARLELGRVRPTALSDRTLAALERAPGRVLATYYVSRPARMPASMRRMELEVGDLLGALAARLPERFAYQIVDPEEREGLEGFAARRRVAPFRVRSVTRDAWDERTVWSTLTLSVESGPEAILAGLKPEHLPHLQALVVAWLEELERPRAPTIALAAPEGFEELADELAARGEVVRVDLDGVSPDGGAPPPDADVLFWMRPARVTGAQLQAVERQLARGASVVVAGGLLQPVEEVRDGVPWVSFRPESGAMEALGAHFGLALEEGLVLDTTAEELEFDSGKVKAAHWIRAIAPDQDFHRWATQPNGTLLFRAPTAFTPVPARLAELGWTAEVVVATTDGAWIAPVPREPVPLADLQRDEGLAVAKQALMIDLRHDDPWRGQLILAGAETPFANGFLHREHVAHRRLVQVLLDETTSSERLVRTSIDLGAAEPLPELGAAARLAWRAFGVLLPVAALLLALHGRGLGRGLARRLPALGHALPRLAGAAGALVGVLALTAGARALEGRLGATLDLTAEGLNSLAPEARAVAERSAGAGPLEATLYVSARERLPADLRAPVQSLEARLAVFARAGAPLETRRVTPEELDDGERAALAALGVEARPAAREDDGVRRVTRFTCALRLVRGAESLVLRFPDARAFERLEFRLALALERLGGRSAPRVAFASDVPRLSAAEAFEQYQEKGLFAPRGTDVFALARESLARNDLDVVHVNPRDPLMPADADVLVWLQPRRSIEAMLERTVRFLHGGGRVVLAAQHFDVLAQQFRGGDFEPRYWPQPQNPDLDHLYLPELGVELVREVLFDELRVPLAAESQLTGRRGTRDFERHESAQPFQIRLAASGYADHPLTRGLGDQAFVDANRLRWDEGRLRELGLTATPLASSSPRTWSYAWKGGWLPAELLRGPAEVEGSSGTDYLGPQPLAVLLEGSFPRPTGPLRLTPDPEPAEGEEPPAEEPWPASAPGELVLIACSSFLENDALVGEEFRGDRLLWNAVAGLAFEGDLGALATRARSVRGFGWVAPGRRLLARAVVIGGGPLALVLAALVAAALRRRAAPGVVA